jgi:hypothetical protein
MAQIFNLREYNDLMDVLVTVGVRILEFMFVAGMIGSAIVIIWSGVEDVASILEPDEPQTGAALQP